MFSLCRNLAYLPLSSKSTFLIKNQKGFSTNIKNLFKPRADITAHKPLIKTAIENGGRKSGYLLRKTVFTISFGALCFSGCAIWSYEHVHRKNKNLFNDIFGADKRFEVRTKLHEFWSKLTRTERIIYALISINAVVCVLFRFKGFQPMLYKHFVLDPKSSSVSQLLGSVFSHVEIFHIFFNMMALFYAAKAINIIFGAEQFTAFYLTSGVVASLASCYARILTGRVGFSLGASGAIYACIMAIAATFPDSRFNIMFIPYDIRAQNLMYSLLAFDTLGLLLGWKRFDHAAHLGGALFGIWYVKYGHQYLWLKQSSLLAKWHKFRTEAGGGK